MAQWVMESEKARTKKKQANKPVFLNTVELPYRELFFIYFRCRIAFTTGKLAIRMPASIKTKLITATGVSDSPRMSAASILLKTGIRLPNKAVFAGPIDRIEMFQERKATTEAPRLIYNNEPTSEALHVMGGETRLSIKKAGSRNSVPNKKTVNKKTVGDRCAGFFLTRMV